MAHVIRQPCDQGVIRSKKADSPCAPNAAPWILAATILGSSMAFIDETAITVALPAEIQTGNPRVHPRGCTICRQDAVTRLARGLR